MNIKHEAKLTMYKSVEQHLDAAGTVVSTISVLPNVISSYKALIAGISEALPVANGPISGISADKSAAKARLAVIAGDLAALLRAYAIAIGNNALAKAADHRRQALGRMRDEALGPVCRTILERVRENRVALAEYGATDAKVTALETALNAFQSNSIAPRTAVGNRKTQNERVRQLIRESDDLLEGRLDNLIENFRETHPDFYETYFNLRNVNRRGNRITQLRGTVTDGATGTPIKNASVTIAGITAKTDSRGEYTIKPIPPGIQTLRIEAEGYTTFENDETQIAPGEIKRAITTLTPAS